VTLRRLVLVLPVIVLATGGCASRRAVPTTGPSSPETRDWPQAAAFVSRWKGRAEAEGRPRSFRLGLLAAPPDRFLLELSGKVGGPVLQAAHDGERLQVMIPRERVVVEGPGNADLVERLLGYPLEPGTLLAVLVGRVQPPPFPGSEDEDPGGDATGIQVRRGSQGWPSGGSLPVPGDRPIEVRYGVFEPGGAPPGRLPSEILIEWSGRSRPLKARLTLRSSHPVSAASPEQFRLRVPDGFRWLRPEELTGDGPLLMSEVEEPET
jgi:hypothetical protein